MTAHSPPPPAPPIGVLVELTHRCPLGCPHCSNPLALERPAAELDTETWKRVFSEAAALGALHVHLSGGEPTARRDIAELIRSAAEAGLYSNLITSGVGVSEKLMGQMVEAGLDHAQLSFQGADKATNDRLGHYDGAWEKKRAFAAMAARAGLPLDHQRGHQPRQSASGRPIHRSFDRTRRPPARGRPCAILRLGALEPRRADAAEKGDDGGDRAGRGGAASASRASSSSTWWCPTITRAIQNLARAAGDASRSTFPHPARRCPCHAAETIPGLEFWNVRDRSLAEIWRDSPAFNAFRGTEWMREPCRSCERRADRLGRLPLPGAGARRRRVRDRPGLLEVADHARIAAMAAAEAEADAGAIRWRSFKEAVEA